MNAYGSVQTDGYDGDGLRTWKVVSGVSTYFLYDGDQIVGIYGVSGSTAVFGGTNTWGAEGLVSRRYQGVTDFYVFDERGNVSQRTSSTGSVTMTETYDAYGARTATGAQPDPWGYMGEVGYYNDGDKSLLLCTHRFYDPGVGRFVTRDPIGYDAGIDLYEYVGNNVINEIDPIGYESVGDCNAKFLANLATCSALSFATLITCIFKNCYSDVIFASVKCEGIGILTGPALCVRIE